MSPADMGSDENIIENINMPPISEDLKNAEGQESLCVPFRRIGYRNGYTQ